MIVRDPNPTVEALAEVLPPDQWFLEGDGATTAYAYNADFRDQEAEATQSIDAGDDEDETSWRATIAIPVPRGTHEPIRTTTGESLAEVIEWVAEHFDDEF